MRQVKITVGAVTIRARLRPTPTAEALWRALPVVSRAQTWGEEIYFRAPVGVAREADARAVVEPGEIAYWIEGESVAIGFGPTPISRAGEVRLAAPVNLWADALDDVRALAAVRAGAPVRMEASGG